MTTVQLDGVAKEFDHHRVLDDISFEVKTGEFLVLLGASGSGKSTTLRLVAGLERVSSGTIAFDDRVLSSVRDNVPANKRSLGFVFQSYALWPHLSVIKNVEYPLRAARGRSRAEIREQALRALSLVRLDQLADRRISQLSGGQQQRVALARAVVGEPAIVLFDEPLSNLDMQLRTELRAEIKRLHQRLGFTAIYVTHDHNEAVTLGDRIAVFEAGRIVQLEESRKLFAQPVTESVARFVGFDNLVPASVAATGDERRYRVETPWLGLSTVVSGAPEIGVGDPVLVGTRAADVTVRPLGSDVGEPAEGRAGVAKVIEVSYSDVGYTATLELDGVSLVGVLPAAEWGLDPEARLGADDWRAAVAIDWRRAHAVPCRDEVGGHTPEIAVAGAPGEDTRKVEGVTHE